MKTKTRRGVLLLWLKVVQSSTPSIQELPRTSIKFSFPNSLFGIMGKDYTQIHSVQVGAFKVCEEYLKASKAHLSSTVVDTDELIFKTLKSGNVIAEWCVISNVEDFVHTRGKIEFPASDVVRMSQHQSSVCVELARPPRLYKGVQSFNIQRKQRWPCSWNLVTAESTDEQTSELFAALTSDRFVIISFKHKPFKVAKDLLPITSKIDLQSVPIGFVDDHWDLPVDRSFLSLKKRSLKKGHALLTQAAASSLAVGSPSSASFGAVDNSAAPIAHLPTYDRSVIRGPSLMLFSSKLRGDLKEDIIASSSSSSGTSENIASLEAADGVGTDTKVRKLKKVLASSIPDLSPPATPVKLEAIESAAATTRIRTGAAPPKKRDRTVPSQAPAQIEVEEEEEVGQVAVATVAVEAEVLPAPAPALEATEDESETSEAAAGRASKRLKITRGRK